MYNPYASAPEAYPRQGNLHHPQPHHVKPSYSPSQQYQQPASNQQYSQQFQPQHDMPQQGFPQQGFPQQGFPQQQNAFPQGTLPAAQGSNSMPYSNFLSDPAASMAAQFAKSGFGQSNNYIQQNFGSYMPVAGDLKYYFKVSNLYVWNKLRLILFPYRHRNWSRMTTAESAGSSGAGVSYAPPSEDINAPDLYIPLMSFISYILLWALFSGLRGDFHPEVFGYLASQTLACSFLDILIFKIGLYLLNCSTQSSFWDLVSFSSYKYVAITVLLCWKNLFGGSWLAFYSVLFVLVGSLSLFLMRSLKFLVLPVGAGDTSANTISNNQRRLRVQFLFLYSVVVQFMIVIFMSR